jgi:hypothetical protein
MSESRLENLSHTERGFLHRHFRTAGYRRYQFRMNGKEYSLYDSPYHANLQTLPAQESYKTVFPLIELTPEEMECDRLQGDCTPRMIGAGDRVERLLEFADALHAFDPAMPMHCPA